MRIIATLALLAAPVVASAGGIAIVDFERAVNETEEGQEAQSQLDTMFSTRQTEIERLQTEFQTAVEDYQQRELILSDEARAEEQQTLMQRQATLQQTAAQYEMEMQQTYMTLLQDLDTKMRTLTETIAAERGYDIVLDRAAAVYVGPAAVDMTDELVRRYNAQ